MRRAYSKPSTIAVRSISARQPTLLYWNCATARSNSSITTTTSATARRGSSRWRPCWAASALKHARRSFCVIGHAGAPHDRRPTAEGEARPRGRVIPEMILMPAQELGRNQRHAANRGIARSTKLGASRDGNDCSRFLARAAVRGGEGHVFHAAVVDTNRGQGALVA